MIRRSAAMVLFFVFVAVDARAEGTVIPPVSQRFADDSASETPDFQRHILPLMGRLGCNTRSCHGSFQGRGGLRLSLFGYDFKADHDALFAKDKSRVDLETPENSKLLQKATLAMPHKGGKRLEEDTWQYRMFVRWMEQGGKGVDAATAPRFDRLEVTPTEILFDRAGKTVPLKVVAHWADGKVEDVTCISRFRTNDESVAEIDENGVVTAKGIGDTHVVAFYDNGVAVTQVLRPVSDRFGDHYPDVPAPTRIDALVVEKLRKLGIVPSELCGDAEFLRRVSIDLTGSLPTPREIEAFLADSSPAKRTSKIDELLERPTYAAYWATRLCDLTGANPRLFNGQPIQNEATRHWYSWLERRVRENVGYDKIVAGIVLGASRKPGESYDDYIKQESAYYRDKDPADFSVRETMPYFWQRRTVNTPDEKALNFSYAFLGVRLECAQCHKHPFDQWTQDDFKQFTAFFQPIRFGINPESRKRAVALRDELGLNKLMGGNLQREIARLVKDGKVVPFQEVFVVQPASQAVARGGKKAQAQAGNGRVATPKLLGGDKVDLAKVDDPRQPLMDWLRSKGNPYFARAFVNRVWANDFGRGIVNPTDDMNLAAPPSNPALLDYLADGFISSGYDMKWLHREIVSSATYQRSFRPNDTNRLDEKNFSRAVVRRLPAEVLLDAVQQAAGSSKELALAVTPAGLAERAIGPKGGAGLNLRRGGGDFASKVFGRSARETTCDCSASNEPNLLQSIYLQNDFEVASALNRPGGWVEERTGANNRAALQNRADVERRIATLKDRISALEKQVEGFRKAGKEKAVADMETQIAARRDDLKTAETRLGRFPKVDPPPPFVPDAVVREAFLRTLSRPPSATEAARSREYFASAGDNAKGLRDLLWALVNTKEFVTNH